MRLGLIISCIVGLTFLSTGCVEIRNLVVAAAANNDNTDNTDNTNNDTTTDDTTDDTTTDDNTTDDSSSSLEGVYTTQETLPTLPAGASLTATGTGLEYYDYEVGTGDMPPSTDADVVVDYAGFLESGAKFDSGTDVTFNLGRLIQGFTEGVSTMKVGGQRRIVIPPDLGYGSNGNAGAGISGTDTIVFIVTLKEIK